MEETFTPTPTETPTLTPTATATATPQYFVEVTTEAGEPARIMREVYPADLLIIVLLFAILVSMWLMYITIRWRGGR